MPPPRCRQQRRHRNSLTNDVMACRCCRPIGGGVVGGVGDGAAAGAVAGDVGDGVAVV